jgi:hypothetical protein
MDLVTVTEDERCHLWVPETGLVTEVDTGFQHFAHSYGHIKLQGWVWNPISHHIGTLVDRIRVY